MSDLIEELKVKLIEILNLADVKPEDFDEHSQLVGGELGIDSIDVLEMVVMVEKDYGIIINNQEVGEKVFSVITSYSIHYTKLYDNLPVDRSKRSKIFFPQRSVAGSYSPCFGGAVHFHHTRVVIDVESFIVGRLKHPGRRESQPHWPEHLHIPQYPVMGRRITSYNVCYTKLLRSIILSSGSLVLTAILIIERVFSRIKKSSCRMDVEGHKK